MTPDAGRALRPGHVVQVDGSAGAFAYCFLTVTEVKPFGVLGYVQVPARPESGQAFYRMDFEHVEPVGPAEWYRP